MDQEIAEKIRQRLLDAIARKDLEGFRAELAEHLSDIEIWRLALVVRRISDSAHQPFFEAFLKAGADPEYCFYGEGYEGALYLAARDGDLEFIKWLVTQGADVNRVEYYREGDAQPRNSVLISAAGSGNVPLLRYLVEQGADISQMICTTVDVEERFHNALDVARIHGHEQAAAFLLEVGVEDQLAPFDVAAGTPLEQLYVIHGMTDPNIQCALMASSGVDPKLGLHTLGKFVYEVPDCEGIFVRNMELTDGRRMLFTTGLNKYDLGWTCELICHLPPNWPLTEQSLQQSEFSWPVVELGRLAKDAVATGMEFDNGAVIMAPNPKPFGAGTELCGWAIELAYAGQFTIPVDHSVMPVNLPIYAEERELAEDDNFLYAWRKQEFPNMVVPDRPRLQSVD